jgi:hypothetical protein
MEQQTPVAALHHAEPEADEADRAIAQIMAFPAALRDIGGAEEDLGDLTVGGVLVASVERAQGEDEPVSARLRQRAGIGTWNAAAQAAAEPDGGANTDLEQLVERYDSRGRVRAGCVDMDAKHRATMLDEVFGPIGCGDGTQKAWRKPEAGIGELSRKRRQGDHAWQSVRRP